MARTRSLGRSPNMRPPLIGGRPTGAGGMSTRREGLGSEPDRGGSRRKQGGGRRGRAVFSYPRGPGLTGGVVTVVVRQERVQGCPQRPGAVAQANHPPSWSTQGGYVADVKGDDRRAHG